MALSAGNVGTKEELLLGFAVNLDTDDGRSVSDGDTCSGVVVVVVAAMGMRDGEVVGSVVSRSAEGRRDDTCGRFVTSGLNSWLGSIVVIATG